MNAMSNVADSMAGQRETEVPAMPNYDPVLTMKALVWRGSEKVVVADDLPRPRIAHEKDVVVKITATTICGSDLHLYTGSMPTMQSGDILGHEFMGVVHEKGEDVKSLELGQRVVVSFDIACGDCKFCKRDEYSGCEKTNPSNLQQKMMGTRTAALFGFSHLTGGIPGGQAEYVRVPYADVNCLRLPDSVPDDKGLFLSDIVPTSFHGTELGDVSVGDTVAIWGLGPIGLLCARWCQIRGAARVIGIDYVKERLDIAKGAIGIEVINFKEKEVVKTLLEMFPSGVDVAIECAGFDYSTTLKSKIERAVGMETDTADIFTEMFTCVRTFGRVAVIGVYAGFANHFPVGAMMEKSLIVRCGQCPVQKYWKKCLESIESGEIDPTVVVTTRGTLSDAPKLYDLFNHKEQGVVKVFLRPDGSCPH